MRRSTGLAWLLLSSAAFGCSGAFAGSLLATGWSPAGAVLARLSLAAAALTAPALVALRGGWRRLQASARPVLLYGALAVGAAQLCYFHAVAHLSVGVALLLEYQGVVLVVGWGRVAHGRRPAPLVLAGAAVSLAGLLLVLGLVGGGAAVRVDLPGVLWGLGAAVGLAAYFVVGSDPHLDVPPLVLACAGLWTGAVALGAAGLAGLTALDASTADVRLADHAAPWWVPVLAVALVAGALAYVTGTVGARALGATASSFVGLTEVLFAVLFAWLLLGQRPTALQAVGGAVVLAGVAAVRLGELRAGSGGAGGVGGAPGSGTADAPAGPAGVPLAV